MRDDIIDEIRKFRDAYAERFNFDIEAMFRDIRERERTSGREYVTLTPNRFVPTTPSAAPDEAAAGSIVATSATQES